MRQWMTTVACLALAAAGIGCASNAEIDPRADAALRRMSDTLAKAKSFSVHVSATNEEQMESGQIVHVSRDAVIKVSRPDQFCADVKRGPSAYKLWHHGNELTLLDVKRNRYAQVQCPRKNEDMLDFLAEKHGIIVPMSDLAFPDPYKVLTEKVTTGVWVDQQDIGGHRCDHLFFTQPNVNWQIWIDTGAVAVPRKVVITQTDSEDQPQFEATLDQWELDSPADAAEFRPQVPTTAKRVDLSELAPADEGDRE